MRKRLKKLKGVRTTFIGTFERYGTKENYHGFDETTVLLKNISDKDDNIVADHLWFNYTKGFGKIVPNRGDKIQFDARCKKYQKGYNGYDLEKSLDHPIATDYKLSHPTRIELLSSKKKNKSEVT